jgi:flavodoxin
MGKKLVAYFSASGVTKAAAERLAKCRFVNDVLHITKSK